jgi:hypothetical protein
VIGFGIIVLGCLSLYLGLSQLRDYRASRNDFGPDDITGLHPLWGKVFKLRRFNAHFNIWMFLGLGSVCIVVGIAAVLGAIGE